MIKWVPEGWSIAVLTSYELNKTRGFNTCDGCSSQREQAVVLQAGKPKPWALIYNLQEELICFSLTQEHEHVSVIQHAL